ncbi:heme biosynthesis protein HemY [Shewanella eurypsychrophilus]|uniref:Heme biosynthesis protein HemY n=1 Tax=Shewanella eurypsychrophilus TaxID=2593656 RepID=A0ABX6V3L6_9GAMM|nr:MULTISPECIES: heme biosynthesis HemY N-terminal domain-containing protein [Shewanella]QFU21120.1 heme biosynthesis protein HemY [Shewanella sp. YLB-09]QPG56411.1 heme biosynthesis protein HemY [Shewanella eurypsychrophilus]
MIRIMIYLGIILLGLCISPFFEGMNGYLYFTIWDYEVETGVVFAIISLIIFYGLLQLAEWLFVFLINLIMSSRLLPEKWRKKAARKHTLLGALALAEEDWSSAEQSMVRGAEKGELPTLNLLAAARAAQHQNNIESRDQYLLKAELEPLAAKAVSTSRTRYLLQQGELDKARMELDKLSPTSKSKLPILRLAIELYQAQADWYALKLLLPIARKRQVLSVEELDQLTIKTNNSLLLQAQTNNEQELEKVWHWLSRAERKESKYLASYCIGLNKFKREAEAKKLLMKKLKSDLSTDISSALADVLTPSDIEERKQIFSLEKKYGEQLNFQKLLAKLHLQNKDYRQAMSYWTKVCHQQPNKDNWLALGETHEHLGEQNNALQSYRQAAIAG